ncbi:MAG: serine dehydratase beta chain, partial [Pseudomonadota bacterium]
MFLSVFDIFKPGIGPSSSHTMGPMVAARRFLTLLRGGGEAEPGAGPPVHVTASLHGSLAWTGKGHATDRAVALGLLGFDPADMDMDAAEAALAACRNDHVLRLADLPEMRFDPVADVVFDWGPPLPGHANGLVLRAFDGAGNLHMQETYYSTGGGFVATERELSAPPDLHRAKETAGF